MLITGLSDRAVRAELHRLRMEGYPIMSTSHTRGYWIGDWAEYKQFKIELLSRMKNYRKMMIAMERNLDGRQMEMEELYE